MADLAVANLEGVLTAAPSTSTSWREDLRAPPETAFALADAGIDLVSVANNHALDAGVEGLMEMLDVLGRTGVAAIGAGGGPMDARRPYLMQVGDECIAILPATTRSNHHAWARTVLAYFPTSKRLRIVDEVQAARELCAFVVVFIHWGAEYQHRPPGRIVALGRALLEAGAGLVVGHHPHVLQGVEHHGDAAIVYSLGNFLFANPSPDTRRTGILLVEVEPGAARPLRQVELLPVISSVGRLAPAPSGSREVRELLRRMRTWSTPLGTQVERVGYRLRFSPRRPRR